LGWVNIVAVNYCMRCHMFEHANISLIFETVCKKQTFVFVFVEVFMLKLSM